MIQSFENAEKRDGEADRFQRGQMQKDMIIRKLRERGCRITRQRLVLLDVILKEDCSCCKEIYYKASKADSRIGSATVYRMINTLEEIGAISRKSMYRIACENDCCLDGSCGSGNACRVELEDGNVVTLSVKSWNHIIETGLIACGYANGQKVRSVAALPYRFEEGKRA